MRYSTLATDYDWTLAENGSVAVEVIAALERFRARAGYLVMVTGRELEDLQRVFPRLDLFHQVVAENGGVLYDPATNSLRLLAEPTPQSFVAALQQSGIAPIYKGHVLVATREENKHLVLDAIQQQGLDLHIIFNKGSVMVLPAGVDKATGLLSALEQLALTTSATVAVGDAENDHAFLRICGRSAAVANALDSVKQEVDIVLSGTAGRGVIELIDKMLDGDLP